MSGQVTDPAKMESHSLDPEGSDQVTEASLSAEQMYIRQIKQLKEQNEMLTRERDEARRALEKQAVASDDGQAAACFQSKLEAVMMDRNATVEQLQQAIGAVEATRENMCTVVEQLKQRIGSIEALVEQARHECATKHLREDPEKKPEDERQNQRQEFLNFIKRWKPCPASPSPALRQPTALYKSFSCTLGSSWRRGLTGEFDQDHAEFDQDYLYWA